MREANWQSIPERGSRLGIDILKAVLDAGGMRAIRFALVPVVLYYLATHRVARRSSLNYIARLERYCAARGEASRMPSGLRGVYRHIHSFALSMAEKYAAWNRRRVRMPLSFESAGVARSLLGDARGALLLVSHLGNFDVAIAHGAFDTTRRFRILMDHAGTRRFNDERLFALDHERVVFYDVDRVGPQVAVELRQAVDEGDIVVIAADRVGANAAASVEVPFLGAPTRLPIGPWVIGHLLRCPVYAVFACRDGDGYRMLPQYIADRIEFGDRRERDASIRAYASDFAARMEGVLMRYPEQWYNFFEYWHEEK